jgi:4-hydroxy-tetrahydrodipicolinate synthase
VVSNEIPGPFTRLTQAALKGDFGTARELQRKYQALMEANFYESNPGPVKFAMAAMGLLEPVWRLPMVAPEPVTQRKLHDVLEAAGLLRGVQA